MNEKQYQLTLKLKDYLFAAHQFAVTPSAENYSNLEYAAREYQQAKYPQR